MATLELARFTVDPAGVDGMLAARPAMVAALRENCPGFRGLYLTRLDERTWLDMVEWDSREDAEAAMRAVVDLPACQEMFRHIEHVVGMEHADVVEQVGSDGRS